MFKEAGNIHFLGNFVRAGFLAGGPMGETGELLALQFNFDCAFGKSA